jgi:ankyrin repeat protein
MQHKPLRSMKLHYSVVVSHSSLLQHQILIIFLVRFQNEDLLKKFIEYDIDVNTLNTDTGTSPLMLAAALGFDHICNILIDAGADVYGSDHEGNTPLHFATQNHTEQHMHVVQTLLRHGADINAVNRDGCAPNTTVEPTDNDVRFPLVEKPSSHIYEEPESIISLS